MKFGYLNEGNPFHIRNNEAQEMINCRVDRGFLEYGEFKVSDTEYQQTPGRRVLLPNDEELVIDASDYGALGSVKLNRPLTGLTRFGLPTPEEYTGAGQYNPNPATDYDIVQGSSLTGTVSGKHTYEIALSQLYKNSFIFRGVFYDGTKLNEGEYVWYYDEEQSKVVVTLAFNPETNKYLDIMFHAHEDVNKVRDYKGKVFYAHTYYLPHIGWESPPSFFEVELDPELYTGVAYVKFNTNLTAPPELLAEYPSIRIRLYRIPYGGDEYLLVYQTLIAAGKIDDVKDEDLGTVLEDGQHISAGLSTDGNTNLPLESNDVVAIAHHKECLFVGLHNSKIVYYSKPILRSEFPAENFFIFEHPVVGLTQKGGFLEVLTTKKVYTIYGDARGFRIEAVDFNAEMIARNTGQSVSGRMIALAREGSLKSNRRDSVLLFDGLRAVDISGKIKETLDTGGGSSITEGDKVHTNRNLIKDNRFYVAEIRDRKTDPIRIDTKNIVYDFTLNGFSVANGAFKFGEEATEGFCYRTKEFVEPAPPSPKLTTYYKGIWLRVKGNYEIDFLGDGEIITTIEGECDRIELKNHNIAPTRFNSYSIRFKGDKDTRIYDWGLYK